MVLRPGSGFAFGAFVVLVVLVSRSVPAGAQEIETGTTEDRATGPQYGGFGYFVGGLASRPLGDLDDALRARDYPTPDPLFLFLGGGGHFRVNRWILGGTGGGLVDTRATSDTHEVSATGGFGLFHAGYVVADFGNLAIFPMLGAGGGGMTYVVSERRLGRFDDALDDPAQGVELSTGGFLFEAAIGVDYLIDFDRKASEKGGMLVGLRAGYDLTPGWGNWTSFGHEADDGPTLGIGGPFVRLVVGGGGSGLADE